MTVNDIISRLRGVTGSGKQYTALCPAHDDKKASLSISEGEDGRILLHCFAGCTLHQITDALGLREADLFPPSLPKLSACGKPAVAAEYIYLDMNGAAVCKKIRRSDKSFFWQHSDGKGGWKKGRGTAPAPLYNCFEVNGSEFVFIVEGEKDVETLRRFGEPAVSLPDGAGSKWQTEYTEFFEYRKVAIISDNDEPGRECAARTASHIFDKAKSVKMLDLSMVWPEIPKHGDVSDLLAAYPDKGMDMLRDLYRMTSEWQPQAEVKKETRGIIFLSDVQSTDVSWLWFPYIPRGKITLISADPGTGKTTFALYLAAAVSAGRPFWGQSENAVRPPETVVYQTAEDGLADTIKPRLTPMEPDFTRIIVIDEKTDPLFLSDERIESVMESFRPALMIFDPLQAYLGPDVDMHRANEVRPVLQRLAQLADRFNTAVILIMHNSKMSLNKALYRPLGSIDIPAAARSLLVMGKDPDDDSSCVLCHEKTSLAARGKSIVFKIDPDNGGVVFQGFSDITADQLLNGTSITRERPSIKLNEAVDKLQELLGVTGYAAYSQISAMQKASNIAKSTLKNAKNELGLQTLKIGFNEQTIYWVRPDIDREALKKTLMTSSA